jgi:hydrogenase-4 component B
VSGGINGDFAYTPFGYANPTRRVLANLLRSRVELRPPAGQADDESDTEPVDRTPSAPDEAPLPGPVTYVSDVAEVTETYLYRPPLPPLRALVRAARHLQSGRLDTYLLYMLLALVAVLAVVAALA